MTGLDGEIRGGRHVMPVRVYYEDTDLAVPPKSLQAAGKRSTPIMAPSRAWGVNS
jgi:hypothetical protein